MTMNWYMRQHGWSCPGCGAFNSNDDAACECQVEAVDREQRRWEKTRRRWDDHDKLLARSVSGTLYRARRFAGGKVTFTVLVPGGYNYRVEWYRAPSSVRWQATAYFSNS